MEPVGFLLWQLATEARMAATDGRAVEKAHWRGHSFATRTGKLGWQPEYDHDVEPHHGLTIEKGPGSGGGSITRTTGFSAVTRTPNKEHPPLGPERLKTHPVLHPTDLHAFVPLGERGQTKDEAFPQQSQGKFRVHGEFAHLNFSEESHG